MVKKKIGALQIGQTPRPDLVAPLKTLFPDCELVEGGALDGVKGSEIPNPQESSYPLSTRLRNGKFIRVSEDFLLPKCQAALLKLEEAGAAASILLCAGTFAGLAGNRPLVKPFDIGQSVLKSINYKSIGIIAPFQAQENSIRERWLKAGFQATVWTADLSTQNASMMRELREKIQKYALQAIVLDFVGHPTEHVEPLQANLHVPVIDLGALAFLTLKSITSPGPPYPAP